MPDNLINLRRERDIKDMEDRETALMHPGEVAIKSRLRLIQFKILHRSYDRAPRLHKMGKVATPNCISSANEYAGFYHTIWDC